MSLIERPLVEVLGAFSDPTPTPGGGSASALAAATGLSLLAMVSQMGRTRSGSDEARQALDDAANALLPLRDHVANLVDDDAKAYDEVVAAYRLPKSTDDERAARRNAVQGALRGAAEVPLDVMRACQAGLTVAYLGDSKDRAIHLLGPLAGKVLRVAPPLTMPLAEAEDYLDAFYWFVASILPE